MDDISTKNLFLLITICFQNVFAPDGKAPSQCIAHSHLRHTGLYRSGVRETGFGRIGLTSMNLLSDLAVNVQHIRKDGGDLELC